LQFSSESSVKNRIYNISQRNTFCFIAYVGLSITLNINQNEYITQAGDTAGAVVVIRPQNQMPFPEDDGIIVSPGHATSIAITQVNKKQSVVVMWKWIRSFCMS